MAEAFNIIDIKLAPGEFFFGDGHKRIHTLLGSCVAITMWHSQRRIGGMCHYLLPSRGNNKKLTQGYFADETVNMFLAEVQKSMTNAKDYEVKVFGGGNMFNTPLNENQYLNISKNNIESGVKLLQEHGFKIKATDLGGSVHRKIFLELWTGDVWVQRGGFKKKDKPI